MKVLAALAVLVLLGAGTLAFGRISDDAATSMGLTAVWWGFVLVAGFLVWRRRPALGAWMAGAYLLAAVAAGLAIGLPSLRDKEVDEDVVTAAPASGEKAEKSARPRNVELAAGRFRSVAHPGRGKATVVRLASGKRVLTLTGFETDSGPDLRLYVSTGDPADGDLGDYEDLGALKGNKGDQQYTLPRGLDLGRYSTVVVWCRAFSVGFTSARLAAS